MRLSKELKKVEILAEEPLTEAKFIKTAMIKAKRKDGKDIAWEIEKGFSSVHILVDNTEEECIELVAQVRVPVKVANPDTEGVCIEACAGLVDKNTSIEQIAKEELQEEMGYDVPLNKIIPVRTYNSNVGKSGGTVTTFKTRVTNDMKISEGGGLPEEDIAIVKIPYDEVIDYIQGFGKYSGIFTDPTTLFLLQDWMINDIVDSI